MEIGTFEMVKSKEISIEPVCVYVCVAKWIFWMLWPFTLCLTSVYWSSLFSHPRLLSLPPLSFHLFRLLCWSVYQIHKQTYTHKYTLTGTVVVNYIFKIAHIDVGQQQQQQQKTDGKTHKFHKKLDFVVAQYLFFLDIKMYLKWSSKPRKIANTVLPALKVIKWNIRSARAKKEEKHWLHPSVTIIFDFIKLLQFQYM